MTTQTATQVAAADLVTASPWLRGVEQAARRDGVVLAVEADHSTGNPQGWAYVWFTGLGAVADDAAVQAILCSKIAVTGTLASWGTRRLRALGYALRALHPHYAYSPAYHAVVAILAGRGVIR